jgi:hypothetical protein
MSAEIIPLQKVAKPRARRPYRKPSPDRQRRRDDYYRAFAERLRFARAQLGNSVLDSRPSLASQRPARSFVCY